MKIRLIAAVVLGFCLLGLAGCGDDTKAASPATTAKSASTDVKSSLHSTTTESGGGGNSETTLPDMGLPDMGKLNDCMEIATQWGNTAAQAMGGPDAAKKVQTALDTVKPKIPSNLRHDFDIVAAGFKTLAEKGVMEGSSVLTSPEFTDSTRKIGAYLQQACTGK